MACGPGLYKPTREKKLAAVNSYRNILKFLLPPEPAYQNGHLSHNDLHNENIFVNPDHPTQITGIIDWQSVQIAPLFDQRLDASFLDYSGLEIGDDLARPKLTPDFDSLSKDQQSAALRLWQDHSLMVAWRRLVKKENPAQYGAIMLGETTAGNLLSLAKRLYTIGEAHFTALLLDLRDEWDSMPLVRSKRASFPFHFTDADVAKMKAEMEKAERGIRIMQYTKSEFGELWPEKGLVGHEQYEEVKLELRAAKVKLIEHLKLSSSDAEEFELYWPFDS